MVTTEVAAVQRLTVDERRRRIRARHSALLSERTSWDPHWRDLADHLRPRGARFLTSERNRGDKRHQHIINGTPLRSLRTCVAGIHASCTSPARRWFRLTTNDPRLAELDAVKAYLSEVEDLVAAALAKSNLYKAFTVMYLDLIVFGTHAMLLEEDAEDDIRAYTYPIGSYCLSTSSRDAVDSIYRSVQMTVIQVVEKFGLEKCSDTVKQQYEEGAYNGAVEVTHVIEPNRTYREGALGPRGKKWSSLWFETAQADGGPLLRESGYYEQPFVAPRWSTTGEDVYGTSPGMEVLGDCKALQMAEVKKAVAQDKVVDPPMQGPASLTAKLVGLLPGDFTAIPDMTPGSRIEPAIVVNPQAIREMSAEIQNIERRIEQLLYADLWLLMQAAERQMTAREVDEKANEKMLQLGAVTENLQKEALSIVVARIIAILSRLGRLPPAPEELEGQEFKLEYTSPMAKAQRMVDVTSIERLWSFVGSAAPLVQDILDKLDVDQMVDEYAERLGAPPKIVRPDDVVAALRKRRAEAQAAAQQAETLAAGADVAKKLSETSTEGDNALNELRRAAGAMA